MREKKKDFLMNNFPSELNVALNQNFTESYFSLFFQAAKQQLHSEKWPASLR